MMIQFVVTIVVVITCVNSSCPSVSPGLSMLNDWSPFDYQNDPKNTSTTDLEDRWVLTDAISGLSEAPSSVWYDEVSDTLYWVQDASKVYRSTMPFVSSTKIFNEGKPIAGITTNEDGSKLVYSIPSLRGGEIWTRPTAVGASGNPQHRLQNVGSHVALFRVGSEVFAADDGDNCLRRYPIEGSTPSSVYGCKTFISTLTPATPGPFASCRLRKPKALAFLSRHTLSIGYVQIQGMVNGIVAKVTSTEVSWLFESTGTELKGAGIFVHPTEDETVFISRDSGKKIAYHTQHMASLQFKNVVEDGSKIVNSYLCAAQSKSGDFKGMSLNTRTGELYIADTKKRIVRVRGLMGNTAIRKVNTYAFLANFRSWQSIGHAFGTAGDELGPIYYHAASRKLYMMFTSAAVKRMTVSEGSYGGYKQLVSDGSSSAGTVMGTSIVVNSIGTRVYVLGLNRLLSLDLNGSLPVAYVAAAGDGVHGATTTRMATWEQLAVIGRRVYGTQRTYGCVRYFDEDDEVLGHFACECTSSTSSSVDGTLTGCRLKNPRGLTFTSFVSTRIAFITEDNGVVRRVDTAQDAVITLTQATTSGVGYLAVAHPFEPYTVYIVRPSSTSGVLVQSWSSSLNSATQRLEALSFHNTAAIGGGAIGSATMGSTYGATINTHTGELVLGFRKPSFSSSGFRAIAPMFYPPGPPVQDEFTFSLNPESLNVSIISPSLGKFKMNKVAVNPATGEILAGGQGIDHKVYRLREGLWEVLSNETDFWSIEFDASGMKLFASRKKKLFQLDLSSGAATERVGTGSSGPFQSGVGTSAVIGDWKGMYAVNSDMFAADSSNNCIVRVNVNSWLTQHYACRCGTEGRSDGTFETCTLGNPQSISFMNHSSSALGYVVEKKYRCIVKLSEFFGSVTRLYCLNYTSIPTRSPVIVAHPLYEDVLFVASPEDDYAVAIVRHGQQVASIMKGQESFGNWGSARLKYRPKDITLDWSTMRLIMPHHNRGFLISICCLGRKIVKSVTEPQSSTHTPSKTLSHASSRSRSSSMTHVESRTGSPSHSSVIPAVHSSTMTQTAPASLSLSSSSSAMLHTRSVTVSFTRPAAQQRVSNTTAVTGSMTHPIRKRSQTSSESELIPATATSSTSTASLEPSPTISRTPPPPPPVTPAPSLSPGERCQSAPPSHVSRFVLTENTVRQARSNLRWNFTEDIVAASLWSDAGRQSTPLTVALHSYVVSFTVPTDRVPAGRGFVQYVGGDGVLRSNASLELISRPSEMRLSMGPWPDYKIISVSEMLDVWLTSSWFVNGSRFCGQRSRSVHVATIVVEPSPDTLLKDTKVANEIVGDTALAASVVSGGGGSAAGDVTSVAILSTMACSQPSQREAGSNTRLLSPLPLSDTVEGMLGGNLVVVAAVVLLHAGATVAATRHCRAWRVPLVAMAVTRFPSWSVAVGGIVHQGTAFLSLRLVVGGAASSAGGVVLGVFGLLYSIVMPIVAVALGMQKIDAVFVTYDYSEPTDERPQGPPKRWLQMILPRGRWEPREMRRAYGVMLSPFAKTNALWFLFVFLSPSVIALGASPSPSSEDGCVFQYGLIAALQLLYVLVLAVTRPFRSVFANVTTAISATTVAVIAIASAMAIRDPGSLVPIHLSAVTMMVQGGVTLLRVIYTMFAIFWERKITRGVYLRPVMRRCPQRHPFDLTVEQQREPLNNRYFIPPPLRVEDVLGPDGKDDAMFEAPLLTKPDVTMGLEGDSLLPDDATEMQEFDPAAVRAADENAILLEQLAASDISGPDDEWDAADDVEQGDGVVTASASVDYSQVNRDDIDGLLRMKSSTGVELLGALNVLDERLAGALDDDGRPVPSGDEDFLGSSEGSADDFLLDAARLDVL